MTGGEASTDTTGTDITDADPSSLRWQQRLAKFDESLGWAAAIGSTRFERMTPLERQGLVHVFEYCHELAWNCLRDYFRWQGIHDLHGPKDAIRVALHGWISNACRSIALKSYQSGIVDTLCSRIQDQFLPLMLQLVCELKPRTSAWAIRSASA